MFWSDLYDKHWDDYSAECERAKTRPKIKDFEIWCEEKDLIPEYDGDYYED